MKQGQELIADKETELSGLLMSILNNAKPWALAGQQMLPWRPVITITDSYNYSSYNCTIIAVL